MKTTFISVSALTALVPFVTAQSKGVPDIHPVLSVSSCSFPTTLAGVASDLAQHSLCTARNQSIVLDANWRWTHNVSYSNCQTGAPPTGWDAATCPDNVTCAQNCIVENVDYAGSLGITTSGSSLSIGYATTTQYGTTYGSRSYLLDPTGNSYQMLKLLNQEFTFDVDVSGLPCGLNGALYLVEMPADGGLSGAHPGTTAGPAYGTGYCDAQCPQGVHFINGTANFNPPTGVCCNEMDLWEANSMATQMTPHPCNANGQVTCQGANCANVCDPAGCGWNPFTLGSPSFYGPKATIDTTKPFTVVTQFITDNQKSTGHLSAINRLYVQNGKVYQQPAVKGIKGLNGQNTMTDSFCAAANTALQRNDNAFSLYGGLQGMGQALGRGMVLTFSIWDDSTSNLAWLDGVNPPGATGPGSKNGNCNATTGDNQQYVGNPSKVVFSNIKWGDIGSTYIQLPSF